MQIRVGEANSRRLEVFILHNRFNSYIGPAWLSLLESTEQPEDLSTVSPRYLPAKNLSEYNTAAPKMVYKALDQVHPSPIKMLWCTP
jgi:hypothetical protein